MVSDMQRVHDVIVYYEALDRLMNVYELERLMLKAH